MRKEEGDPYVGLARYTLETYVRMVNSELPEDLPEMLTERAGVFVSITKHEQLRGCIGTFYPQGKT